MCQSTRITIAGAAAIMAVLAAPVHAEMLAAVGLLLLAGCASRPINEPITRAEPASGYSVVEHVARRPDHDPSTLLILAFPAAARAPRRSPMGFSRNCVGRRSS